MSNLRAPATADAVVTPQAGRDQGRRESARACLAVAVATAGAVVAACLVGIARPYGPDESTAVGAFIATPSLKDPFTQQLLFTNHPLASFVDHLIYTITGSDAPWLMRIPPVTCAAMAVGLLAYACTRRFGWVAGAAAGLLVAANPQFVKEAGSVRGYPQLTLCAVASTLLLLQLLDHRAPRGWRAAAYVLVLAVGIGTHVYMLVVIGGQFVYVFGRRRLSTRWMTLWLVSGAMGSLVYLHLARAMLSEGNARGQLFRPTFPFDLAVQLLGANPVAVVAFAVLVVAGLLAVGLGRPILLLAVAYAAVIAFVWLVARPYDLYPRFFVWLTPAAGLATAAAIARWPKLVAVAALGIVFGFAGQRTMWRGHAEAHVAASKLIIANNASGGHSCAAGYDGALTGYTHNFKEVFVPTQFSKCDLVVVLDRTTVPRTLISELNSNFAYRTTLPARVPALVFSRTPIQTTKH